MFTHAQAPCRIGLAGGGTDLPAWTRERAGLCLNLAVATYTHAAVISRPDGQVVAVYRQRDEAGCATEIANGLIRESALMHGFEDGFEVHTLSQMTSRGSGLGVSSSIAVALAAAFARAKNIRDGGDESLDPQLIARDAWTVEINRLRRPIGRQDHMAAAHGGLRLYRFEGDAAAVERVFSAEDAAWVAEHVLLVPLAEGHDSRAILSAVHHGNIMAAAMAAVPLAVEAIERRDPEMLGRALYAGHASKTAIPGAVTESVARVVAKVGGTPGVYGCKVAGAGGGGHVVVCCEPAAREALATGVLPVAVAPDLYGVRSEGWR